MTKPLFGPPKVGADILSYCTKCKMELAHVVVSMVDTKASKVECKTCKSVHKHRGVPGTTKRKKTTRKTTKTTVKAADLWEQRMASSKKNTIPYQVADQFAQGDVINHSKFGVGIVEQVRDPGKIIVLFKAGEKILVHGRS